MWLDTATAIVAPKYEHNKWSINLIVALCLCRAAGWTNSFNARFVNSPV